MQEARYQPVNFLKINPPRSQNFLKCVRDLFGGWALVTTAQTVPAASRHSPPCPSRRTLDSHSPNRKSLAVDQP
jgi:hypothetical protein